MSSEDKKTNLPTGNVLLHTSFSMVYSLLTQVKHKCNRTSPHVKSPHVKTCFLTGTYIEVRICLIQVFPDAVACMGRRILTDWVKTLDQGIFQGPGKVR